MDLHIGKFKGYELLDSGDGRKLERFGDTIIDRPCPQAIWPTEGDLWKTAKAAFQRFEGGTGDWNTTAPDKKIAPARWEELVFDIRLTGFGNVGLFPEHTCHWDWMRNLIGRHGQRARVLNLFAYTGGASLACAQAGAQVTHVDSAKSVNTWAKENASRSGIPKDLFRFITDDALKFVRREHRRENRYHGIILDPPTFGRGAKGEVWKIERDFARLVDACKEVLAKDPLFILITSHSPGVTPTVLRTLLGMDEERTTSGEMILTGGGPPVPSGVYARHSFGR